MQARRLQPVSTPGEAPDMSARKRGPGQIERPESLTKIVADRLREDIINGRFGLGEMLSESALAAALGISKTPVREALVRLGNEGLVTIVPRKGTFVFTVSGKELGDMCVVRLALETSALRAAFKHAPKALTNGLQSLVDAMREALARRDIPTYLRLDTRFHQELFRHCDNELLVRAYRLIDARTAALRNRLGADATHVEKSFREHAAIADALRDGQLKTALDLLERHVSQRLGSYWEKLESEIA